MSLLCRLKNLVHKGILKAEDLDRIVIIPKDATNGEVAMQMFGDKGESIKVCTYNDKLIGVKLIKDWWNNPYRKDQK